MCLAGVIANLGKAIGGQVSNFDPRSLTDALWGFAKMGGKLDGGTISKLAQRVKELASKFKPQEAANALWALVKLDQQNGGNAMKVWLCCNSISQSQKAGTHRAWHVLLAAMTYMLGAPECTKVLHI